MSLLWLLVIVLVVLALAGSPGLGFAPANYGYYPMGGFGLIALILILFLLIR